MAKASFAQIQCEIVTGILEGLGVMFGGIINSEIEWILTALNPATYGGIINTGVNAIWTTLRNIVNALLVLGLIGIAIATILGYKKYAWKQILWKLILIALLVNFSLVISGIVVDTSNYFTVYFLNMSQKNGSIAPRIMTGYGYTKDTTTNQYTSPELLGENKYKSSQINQDEVEKKGVGKFTVGLGNAFIIAFITTLTGGFAVIALLAIYLTILIRNVVLIMLLGFSSIAFAAWIFPDTEKYWKLWWSNFIKWCFFPVIFAFTLYLGLTVMDAMPKFDPNSSMAVAIIYMTLFSVFLVGGLIFSLQSGGAVSQLVMKQSNKIGAAAGAFIGDKALKGAMSSETWGKAQKKLEGSKFAPTHDIGVWMKNQPKKIRSAELKQIEEYHKTSTPDQIRTDIQAHKNDKARSVAGFNTLIEKGKVSYEKDAGILDKIHNYPGLNASGLKKIHPELYAEYFTKPEDMNRAIEQTEQRTPGIPREQAKNRVIAGLTANQLLKSSPDDIKSGNWENVLDRLNQKGTEYTELFFQTLLDKKLPAGNFASMLRSTNDTEKQTKWVQGFIKSNEEKIHGSEQDALEDLRKRKYYKNRFLAEFLPELNNKDNSN